MRFWWLLPLAACSGKEPEPYDRVEPPDPTDTTDPTGPDPDPTGGCVDGDGDGAGPGCGVDDCDDTAPQCIADCADLNGDGTAECAQPLGTQVLLYVGNDGGLYDIYEEDVQSVYEDAGYTVVVATEMPAGLEDDFGLVIMLSPLAGFPDASGAGAVLGRGGTVVVAVEHGAYGDPVGATTFLSELGSSMSALSTSLTSAVVLLPIELPGVTDGVLELELYYVRDIDVGSGTVLAGRADGQPGIGYERVGNGQVLLVPDGSMFGFTLYQGDNVRLLQNLAP